MLSVGEGDNCAPPEVSDLDLAAWLKAAEAAADLDARLAELREIQRAINLLQLSFATTAANLMAAECSDRDPESAFNDIWEECRISKHMLSDRLCVAQQLEKLPKSIEAFFAGSFGFQHLSALAHSAERIGEERFNEDLFLGKAVDPAVGVGEFNKLCLKIRHRLDAEGMAKEEREAAQERRLELKQWGEGGWYSIEGMLDPIGGAVVRAALEPLARVNGTHDDRPREQRLADALVELAGHGAKVALNITASIETIEGAAGSSAGHMEYAGPISGEAVRRFIGTGTSWRRILFDSKSVVIDAGRARRVISPAMAAAMHARDQGCRWPGCSRPSSHCDGHHKKKWSEGGDTELGNLLSACWRHHDMLTAGWQLVAGESGNLIAIPPPDG